MAHTLITEVSEDGDRITLEDGSIFIIAASDIPKAICWDETERVVVTPNRSGGVRIKNLDRTSERSRAGSVCESRSFLQYIDFSCSKKY